MPRVFFRKLKLCFIPPHSHIYSFLIGLGIILFFVSGLESIPIQHITLSENFQKIRITKKDYYSKVHTPDIFELIKLTEDYSSIEFLIPKPIYEKWLEQNIPFTSLAYPTTFSEIDPQHKIRLRAGCIPLKSMLNGYKSSAINQLYLHCIEKEFPHIARRFHIGRSVENRKITALRILNPRLDSASKQTNPSYPRSPILFHCGIHGNEMIAIEHCYDIIQQLILYPDRYPSTENLEVWVIPIVNPDGLDSHWFRSIHTGRTNARNIDLNRNFPFLWNSGIPSASSGNPKSPYFRGFQPASEPEVQSLLNLFETKRFLFSMSIHCYANSILIPYSIPDTTNPKPNLLQDIGERLTKNINSQREDKPFLSKKNLYPVDGTDQDSFFHSYGTFAYLLETSHLVENYLYVPMILEDIRPSWENLLKEESNAYKWKILVLNHKKEPIVADIQSSAYRYFHGEIRKSNRYGKYNEVVPNSGKVKITVTAEGYRQKNISLTPSRLPERIEVLLEPNP